jgi:tyrosyl-tRNA synthetase
MVGDPTGRESARPETQQRQLQSNAVKLENQLRKFFRSASHYASKHTNSHAPEAEPKILDNASWHRLPTLGFLREVGSFASMRTMLSRERYVSKRKDVVPG